MILLVAVSRRKQDATMRTFAGNFFVALRLQQALQQEV